MKALVVIAPTGYQDIEYAGTCKGLEEGGFAVIVCSTEVGECRGKLGGTEQSTLALRDAHAADVDRVAFIGWPGARALADDADAQRLARETVAEGKVLGAICIAPLILAHAGVLQGKRATVWDEDGEQAPAFERLGISYTGEAVTVDGNIVTGNGPEAAEEVLRVPSPI